MLLKLDHNRHMPKSLQILEQIRQRIDGGALRAGERLPSTRHLAEQLGVHRSTVATAYQELWAQGWIELGPGATPKVRARLGAKPSLGKANHDFDWEALASSALEVLRQAPRTQGCSTGLDAISFRRLDMDPRLRPADAFRACLQKVMKARGTQLLGYGAREGYRPLREYVARRMRCHGVEARADEVLLTSGSQQALDLMLRLMAAPGRRVAVELPTYGHVLPLQQLHGLEPLGIPMGSEGMDLDILAQQLQEAPPALVYTMPNFQNPTGLSTGAAHRERLLQLCEAHGVPLLEDGFEEEMKYFGKVAPPIKALDRRGLVAYVGTFSKVLFPGIRIGWIVAPSACIQRLAELRTYSELSPAQPLQAAMHEFCERGCYDLHLSRMHRVFRRRMQVLLRALKQRVNPAWAQWQEPQGGFLLWMKLSPSRIEDWEAHFAAHGVEVTSGDSSFAAPNRDQHIRLSISLTDEAQIEAGVTRLARALADAHGESHGH